MAAACLAGADQLLHFRATVREIAMRFPVMVRPGRG